MTTQAAVLDRTVTLNGLRFHYRDWPHPGARSLLLLHGFTGHARTWDTFAAAMQDRYRVLALDQRGHGESQWAPDYAPERYVEDIEAFVAELGLQDFALLGLSLGGRNAYTYTAAHADTVERLVIVDVGPEIASAGSDRIRAGVTAPDVFDDPEDAVRRMREQNPRAPDDALRYRALNNLMQTADGRWTWRYDKALRAPDRPMPRPNPEAAWRLLPQITCPTLLVRGAESDVLSEQTAARMVETIPNCRLVVVPNSGHSVPLDNPPGFLTAVRDFLSG